MPTKSRTIVRTHQVEALLRLLELTPATAVDIHKASVSFGTSEEPGQFADPRRVREKLESLVAAGLVVFYEYALGGRHTMKFYQLARDGYRFLLFTRHLLRRKRRIAPSKPRAPATSRTRHERSRAELS